MELIVVIAVIGILAAVLIPTFSGAFTSANLAADRGDASNMTRILRTAYPAGIPDNIEAPEIRAAVSAEAEFSFVPRSAADGYTFWYDRARQEITVGKASELPASAGAAGHNAPSLEEVIPGYLMVDVGGNRVADLLASFRNLLSLDEYNTLKAGAEALKEDLPAGFTAEQVDDLVRHLVGEGNPDNFSPANNLYINDFGSFTTATEGVVTRMIFSDGITMISAVSATVTAVRNDIVVPSSVSFVEEGAFAAIRQTEEDGETIETNLIFRDADIKVESNKVFSDYLLEKNPGLANLPPMRAEPVGKVEFEITFDQPTAEKKGWTISSDNLFYEREDKVTEDGAEQTVGTTKYRPFRLTINPQVTGEDKQIYISDTWRFRYQNLPDGSVAVQVKLFDAEGVVGEDTITYRVPETLDLQFKDSTLRFAELTSALGFAEKTGQKVTYTLKVGKTSYTFYKGIVQDLQNIQGLSEGTSESVGTIAWLRKQGYIEDNNNALTKKGETLQAALSMSGLFGEFNFGTERKVDEMSDIAFLLGTDGWKAYLDSTDGSGRTELICENGAWKAKEGGASFTGGDPDFIYFERVSQKPENSASTEKISGKLTTVTTATNPSTITYTLKKASAADVEAYGTNGPVVGDLIMISQESGTRQTITNVQVDIDENGTPENDLGFTRVQFIEYHTFNYFLAAVYGVDEKQWQFDGTKDLTLEVKVGDEVVISQTLNDAKPESESTISQTIANQENTSYQYEFSYRTTYEPETSSPILEMGKMEVKIANVKNPYTVNLYSYEAYPAGDPGYEYFHNGVTEGGVTEGGKGDYEIVGFDSSAATGEPQTATLTWHLNFSNLKYKFKKDSAAYNTFDNIQATEAMTNRQPYEISYQIKEASPETFYLTYLNGRQVGQAGGSADNPIVLARGETLVDSTQTYGVAEGAGTINFAAKVRPIEGQEQLKVLEFEGWDTSSATEQEKTRTLTVRYYPDGVGNSLYAEANLHYVVRGESKTLPGTMVQINGREVGTGVFRLTEGEGISLTNNTSMYYENGLAIATVYFNSANADYGAGSNRQKLIVEYRVDESNWTTLTVITPGDKTYTSGTPLKRPGENYNVSPEQLLEFPETLKAGRTGKLRFTYVFRCNEGGSYGTNLKEAVSFADEVAFEIVPKSSVNHLALRLDYQSAEPDQTGTNVITVPAGTEISRLNAAYGSYLQFINAQGTAQTCYLYAKAPYSTTAYKPDDYLVNVELGGDLVLGSGQGWSADSFYEIKQADNGKTLTYTVNFYGVEYSASATLRVVSDRPVRLMSLNGIRYYDGLVYAFAPGDTLIAGSPTQIYYSYTAAYEAGFSMPTTESATNYMKFFLSTDQNWSSDDAEWGRGQTFEAAWNSWTNQDKAEGQRYYLIIRAMSSNTLFEDIAVPFTYSGSNQTVEAQVYSINARNVTNYGEFEVVHNEGLVGWSNYVGISLINSDGTTSVKYYSEEEAPNFKVFVKYDKPIDPNTGEPGEPYEWATGDWYDKWNEIEVTQTSSARPFAFDAALGTTGHFRILYSPDGFDETESGGVKTYTPKGGIVYDAEAPFRVSGFRVPYINNRSYGYLPDDGAKSVLTEENGAKTLTTTLTRPFLFFEGETFQPHALNLYSGVHRKNTTYAESQYLGRHIFKSDEENGEENNKESWAFLNQYELTVEVVKKQNGETTATAVPTTGIEMRGSGVIRLSFTAPGRGSFTTAEDQNYYSASALKLVTEIPFETRLQAQTLLTDEEAAEYGLAEHGLTGEAIWARIYRINNRQTDNTGVVTLYDGEQIALHESYSATAMAVYAPDGRRRDLYSAATNGLNPYYGMIGRNYGTEEMYNVSDSYGRLGYNEYWLIKTNSDTSFRKLGLDPAFAGASSAELIRANYLGHVFQAGESGTLVWVRVQYGVTYVAEIDYTVAASEPLNGQDWENWSEEKADLTWDKRDSALEEMLVIEKEMTPAWYTGPDDTATQTETRKLPFKFTLHPFDKDSTAYVLREWSSDIHSKSVNGTTCYAALYDQAYGKLITEISDAMRGETGASVTLVYVARDTGEIMMTGGTRYAELSLEKVSGMIRGDAYTVDTKTWEQKEGETVPPSYSVKVLKTPVIQSDAQVGVISKINGVTYSFNEGDFYIVRADKEDGELPADKEVIAVSSDSAAKILTRVGYYTNVNFTDKFRYFVKGTKKDNSQQNEYVELTVTDGKLNLVDYESGTLKVVFYYSDIIYVAERSFLKVDPPVFELATINGRNLKEGTRDAEIPVFQTAVGERIGAFSGTLTTSLKVSTVGRGSYWSYVFCASDSYNSDWKYTEGAGAAVGDIDQWSVPGSGYLVMTYSSAGMVAQKTVYLEVQKDFKPEFNKAYIRLSLRSAADGKESPRTFIPDGGGYGIEDPNLLILSAEDGIMATTGTYVRYTRPDGTVSTAYASESNLESDKFRLYLRGENIQGDPGDEEGRKKLTLADLLAADTAGKALLGPTLKATYTVDETPAEKTLYGSEAAQYYSRYSETNSQITDVNGGSWTEGEARVEITREAVLDEANRSCVMTVTRKEYPAGAEQDDAPTKTTVTVYTVRYYAVKLIIEYDDYGITYRGEWNLVVLA